MKKIKLYLDTTIFNFFFADEAPQERDITRKFFKEIDQYEIYFSDIVIKEIARCHSPKREKLLRLIEEHSPEELMLDEEARILAHKYVKEKIIPVKYMDDAHHIALASVHGIDALLSWNFEHIVKLKTKREVVGINMFMGYGPIDIYSPWEVVGHV